MNWMGQWLSNRNAFGLTVCRGDIPEGAFGYVSTWWCDWCKSACGEPVYHMTHRQTWEQPEEGVETCPECGSEECGENQNDHGMKVTNRYSIHRNPNYRKAS